MPRQRITSHLPSHRTMVVTRLGGHRPRAAERMVHPHASLAYYVRGAAEVWCGTRYTVNAGDILMIPEGMPHYTVATEAVEVLGLGMCTSCMTSQAGRHIASMFHAVADGATAVRTVAPRVRPQLEQLLVSLESELQSAAPWHDLALEGHLLLLASIMRRADCALLEAGNASAGVSLSARALSFITQHATEGISLAQVARHVHRAPAHTAAVVKAETGRTVVEWITQARLAAARQLLLQTDENVEAIGARMGFASPSQFHRVFKRHHGTTPTAWRKAHLTGDASSPTEQEVHHGAHASAPPPRRGPNVPSPQSARHRRG